MTADLPMKSLAFTCPETGAVVVTGLRTTTRAGLTINDGCNFGCKSCGGRHRLGNDDLFLMDGTNEPLRLKQP